MSDLIQEIRNATPGEYAVIDLGQRGDKKWLTSRLFIFSALLEHIRQLRYFVFVVDGRFVGAASLDMIQCSLARQYPWLEDAFAAAQSSQAEQDWDAVALNYIDRIQMSDYRQPEEMPGLKGDEWVLLGDHREHAKWLNEQELRKILGNNLQESSVIQAPNASAAELSKALLRSTGDLVALIDQDGRFLRLLDRGAGLEQLAALTSQSLEQQQHHPPR